MPTFSPVIYLNDYTVKVYWIIKDCNYYDLIQTYLAIQINHDIISADTHFGNLYGPIIENCLVDKSSLNLKKSNVTNKTSGARGDM